MLAVNSPLAAALVVAISLIATASDLRTHRIPNWLTLGGVCVVLGAQAVHAGWAGIGDGLLGLLAGLLLLLPFYAKGGMAAGDVKLLAAVGAGVGWPQIMVVGGATLLWGMLLAFLVLALRGGLQDWLQRYQRIAVLSMASRRINYEPAACDSAAAKPFPYAMAILLGLLSVILAPVWRAIA
jgi:prepilin peptidase CpaA